MRDMRDMRGVKVIEDIERRENILKDLARLEITLSRIKGNLRDCNYRDVMQTKGEVLSIIENISKIYCIVEDDLGMFVD